MDPFVISHHKGCKNTPNDRTSSNTCGHHVLRNMESALGLPAYRPNRYEQDTVLTKHASFLESAHRRCECSVEGSGTLEAMGWRLLWVS